MDVVVFPVDVKLGEQGELFHVVDEFWDKRKWVDVSNGVEVQVVVILTRP